MAYTLKTVLDRANELRVLATAKSSADISRPHIIRFHGKKLNRVVQCEGTDNAMAFLLGVEISQGFRYSASEWKNINRDILFEPDRRINPVRMITMNE